VAPARHATGPVTGLELVTAAAGPTLGITLGALELELRRRHHRHRRPSEDERQLAELRERYATSDDMSEAALERATLAIVDPAGYAKLLRQENEQRHRYELEQRRRELEAGRRRGEDLRATGHPGTVVDPAADHEARRAARERERWSH
jgi:predicted HTH domain antitoxin